MTRKEYNISVDEFADNVYRFALKLCNDKSLADDIVQESFSRLWMKHESVEQSKVRSYLFQTAYNYFIDLTRKGKRMVITDESTVYEGSHSDQYSDLSEILDRALSQLNDIQRSVVLLRDYEGYSYQEIGEVTNLSESQVKVYIYRARKQMKKLLGNDIHALI